MKPHVKIYIKHFNLGMDDMWYCELCRHDYPINNGLDLHHIKYKSRGGGDEVENVICLCRKCHDLAHNEEIKPKLLQLAHNRNL